MSKAVATLIDELSTPLELIGNIIYLAQHDTEDPALIKSLLDAVTNHMSDIRGILVTTD